MKHPRIPGGSPWTVSSLAATLVALLIIVIAAAAADAEQTCGGAGSLAAAAAAPKQERYEAMLSRAEALAGEIVALRRELHRRPALKYEEYEAQALVMRTLDEIGVSRYRKSAITGVVADIGSESADAVVVVLRGDMDALPIQEEAEVDYRSEIDGVMHACGHDAHTAMLLGAAMLLKPLEERLRAEGKAVRFAFQPAEEGGAGGWAMVRDGVLEGARAAFALHTSSQHASGLIAAKPGVAMGAGTSFSIHIRGKGGHASAPHTSIDPVNAALQVGLSLNTIVGRMIDNPNDPVVIGVSTVHAGGASNVIPSEATVTGTIRTWANETRERMMGIVRDRATAMAEANGCEVEVNFGMGNGATGTEYRNSRGEAWTSRLYPAVLNNPELVELGARTATELFKAGDGSVPVDEIFQEERTTSFGGEDFSFFGESAGGVPAVMFRIGHAGEDPATHANHHHPAFFMDEAMLHKGAAFLAQVALDFLDGK